MNATGWEAPQGFVLTRHEGYYINQQGFQASEGRPFTAMPDGQIGVAWFDESAPFIEAENGEYRGYSPNVQVLPIVDGWVPPAYTLHSEEEAPNVQN